MDQGHPKLGLSWHFLSWLKQYHTVILKGKSLSFVFNLLIVLFLLSNSLNPIAGRQAIRDPTATQTV